VTMEISEGHDAVIILLAVLAGLLAISAGGYYAAKRLIRRWLRAIRFSSELDKGIQQISLSAPLHLDYAVRLKPSIDPGQQGIDAPGPLVLEEKEKP